MVLAFSGHRPEKLPWGTREDDPRCDALKQEIAKAVEAAAGEGADRFLCGMARGCDLWFAEAVLELAQRRPGVYLEAYLPCPSQADIWPEEDRVRYRSILRRCSSIHMVEPVYSRGCMLRRNRVMVDRCDVLLTVWDGTRGGTAAAVRYAQETGRRIRGLWL